MLSRKLIVVSLMLLVCVYEGCKKPAAEELMDLEQIEHQRARFALKEEPSTLMTVHEVYDALNAENEQGDKPTSLEVAIVGRVGELEASDDPNDEKSKWYRGKASFKLFEPADVESDSGVAEEDQASATESTQVKGSEKTGHHHAHGEDHDCPFCAAGGPKIQTVVRFRDESGELIPIDARALFGFAGKDLVVIRGQASLKPGNLVVEATGIYVRH